MEKEGPPPSYAQNPPPYGHPSTQYGQPSYGQPSYGQQSYGQPSAQYGQPPPPVVTAPQPAYHPPPPPSNNNMMMSNNVVIGGGHAGVGGGTTIIRTQRGGNNDSCCSGTVPKFNATAGKVTGFIMLSGGIATIICIVVALIVRTDYTVSGLGSSIGGAIFFYIPTGILGACSYEKSACVVISFLVMCILTSIEAFCMTAYEGVAAGLLSYDYVCEWIFCYWDQNSVVVAMHVIACIIAFVIFITSIVGSVHVCMGMNGASVGTQRPATMVVTSQPAYPIVQTSSTMQSY